MKRTISSFHKEHIISILLPLTQHAHSFPSWVELQSMHYGELNDLVIISMRVEDNALDSTHSILHISILLSEELHIPQLSCCF